jgi:RNA polymerase sigma-70 factor, ECF subfamily
MEERMVNDECHPQDEKYIELLIDTYGYDVYKLAYFYMKDKGKAEDITQEVFFTCLHKLKDFRGDFKQIKYWLLKITSNKCKDSLRSWAHKYTTITNAFSDSLISKEPTQESILIKKQENSELVTQIFNLSIKYREVILLYYYQEMKINEIAELLNINENSVKTRLRRGREKLRSVMKGDFENDE